MNAQHQPVRTRVPHLYRLVIIASLLALALGFTHFTASTAQAVAVAPVVNMALDAPRAATGTFYTDGNRIIGPDGNVFVPKGVNISGYQWDWDRSTVNDVNSVTACWKFNTIRLNWPPAKANPKAARPSPSTFNAATRASVSRASLSAVATATWKPSSTPSPR